MKHYASLKYRIVATLICLETIMMVFLLWQITAASFNAASIKQSAFEDSVILPLRDVARIALMTEDFTDVQNYIVSFSGIADGMQVIVARTDGRVMAASNVSLVGRLLPVLRDDGDRFWRRVAIENESGSLGSVSVEFTKASLVKSNRATLIRGLTIAALGLAIMAIATIAIIHLLTRRLEKLRDVALRMAAGEFAVRAPTDGADEIGELGRAFDSMAQEVQKHIVGLTRSEERFALAVSGSNDGIWDWNIETGVAYFSPVFKRILGQGTDASASAITFWQDRIHPEDRETALTALTAYLAGDGESYNSEHRIRTVDERYIWGHVRGRVIRDAHGAPVRMAGSLTDVTERRRFEALIQHQALHDPLTDLPNRVLLADRLAQALQRATRKCERLAVVLMDLDRFKDINDTLGHSVGDLVLRHLSDRIRDLMRASDTLSRFGGDEFVLLLPDADRENIGIVIERIRRAVDCPLDIGTHRLHLEASFGCAFFPGDGDDADTLIKNADIAMYHAKRNHSGVALYAREQDMHNATRLSLISELRDAIHGEQLVLHYQPKLDLRTGMLYGTEALVRWSHPQRGMVPPGDFIPGAESSGLIHPLTHWVLNAAMRTHRDWRDAGVESAIAVNVSTRALLDPELPRRIQNTLDTWRVDARWLHLEITESAIMTDPKSALAVLSEIHAMGVRLSIDDYGTGYSSLAYLKNLPVSELKIDRSFVKDMLTDAGSRSIVRSTIDLGHNLGLSVIAEGVETEEHLSELRAFGCDAAQGYFIGRPAPAATVFPLLARSQTRDIAQRPATLASRN